MVIKQLIVPDIIMPLRDCLFTLAALVKIYRIQIIHNLFQINAEIFDYLPDAVAARFRIFVDPPVKRIGVNLRIICIDCQELLKIIAIQLVTLGELKVLLAEAELAPKMLAVRIDLYLVAANLTDLLKHSDFHKRFDNRVAFKRCQVVISVQIAAIVSR